MSILKPEKLSKEQVARLQDSSDAFQTELIRLCEEHDINACVIGYSFNKLHTVNLFGDRLACMGLVKALDKQIERML